MDNGHWNFPKQMGTQNYCGFVYLVVHKASGRAYIGRKLYRKGGSKKSKTYGHQAAWRNYKTSNKNIMEDIKKNGIGSFEFYCLAEYENKLDLHYAEVKTIMANDAIIKSEFYNNHSPEIYVPPPCRTFRRRRESINTLIQRALS